MLLRAASMLTLAAVFAVSCGVRSGGDVSPLIGAARAGDTARMEELLRAGSDPDVRGGVHGWTALLHAIHKNREGAVRVLLAGGAGVNVRGGGVTPLIMASGYGYVAIVRLLLEAGADPRLKADDGVDALTAAISGVPDIDRFTVGQCQTETVEALLAADPGLRLTPGAWTRVSAAVAKFSGCEEVIRLISARQQGGR